MTTPQEGESPNFKMYRLNNSPATVDAIATPIIVMATFFLLVDFFIVIDRKLSQTNRSNLHAPRLCIASCGHLNHLNSNQICL